MFFVKTKHFNIGLSQKQMFPKCFRDLRRLKKRIKKAGSVLDMTVEPLEIMTQRRILHKIESNLENPEHQPHDSFLQQQCLQSDACAVSLLHRSLQEIISAHSL